MGNRQRKELFVTLDDAAYASAKAVTRADVRTALERGKQDLAKAQGKQRATSIDGKIRYR